MAKNLVIVESPAKAKTLSRFLGSDYLIKSSYGHIRDLPKKGFGVDLKKNFQPTYEISPDKEKVVSDLKKATKGKTVWLASDEDREGEAIAWHICYALGLKPDKTNRIVFHEITKPAITEAIKKPRSIDMKLVDAQQARRILDRLVGYELSPVLWKKVRTGLSAGRVQSVAVRLIVERERQIKDFKAEKSYKVTAVFAVKGSELLAELPDKLPDKEKALGFLKDARKAEFKVEKVEQKPGTRSPSSPFTTSTLQQEAARRLGFSVRQTMTLAQKLYENGHITYMRTDSTNLSNLAVNAAKNFITKSYGDKYSQPKQYATRSKGAQEAHEAIRPTRIPVLKAGRDSGQHKLYELIWKRAVASQMSAANIQKTEITIGLSNRPDKLKAYGEVLTFDGFYKVYGGSKEDQILPEISERQSLKLQEMTATEVFSRPPSRYGEGSLVKKLEELGIGRPSTYAPTIGTIQDRGYVEKGDIEGEALKTTVIKLERTSITESEQQTTIGADRNKLYPTDLGKVVTDFLVKYFSEVLDYEFTAKAEEELDQIANGKIKWQLMLDEFYGPFHKLVEKSEGASRAEATKARKLGIDPKTKKPVYARLGRFGPVLQLGEALKDKDAPKPVFAPIPETISLDTVTLADALPMFNLPRTVGTTDDGKEITANIGPYGPYLKVEKEFTSIKDKDPLKITESEAREVLKEKQKEADNRVIANYGTIKVLRGRYGPYITDGKTNVKVPKDQKPESLTEQQSKALLQKTTKKAE